MNSGISPHDVRGSGARTYSEWLQLLDDDALLQWLRALELADADEPTDREIAAVLGVYAALRALEAGSADVIRSIAPDRLHEVPRRLLSLTFFERMRRAGMMTYESFETETDADTVAYAPSAELVEWTRSHPDSTLADWLSNREGPV